MLTREQAQLFLEKNFAVVATINADGSPHVTPVWVDWDGECVIFNTALGRVKEQNLRRDPRVSIEVTSSQDPYRYVSVAGRGELTTDGAEEMIDDLRQVLDGRRGHSCPIEQLEERGAALAPDPLLEERLELATVRHAVGIRAKALVARELRQPERVAERREEAVVRGCDHHAAVA